MNEDDHGANRSVADPDGHRKIRDRAADLLATFREAVLRLSFGHTLHPTDAPRGHAPGKDAHRILLLGSGPVTGWGVTTHELALPGALARAVSSWTGRGCTVDLAANKDLTVATALTAAKFRDLWKYDGIVVTLGVIDSLMLISPSKWRRHIGELLEMLIASASAETEILVVGIPPIRSMPAFDTPLHNWAQARARLLNDVTARLCSATDGATFVPLPAADLAAGDAPHRRSPLQHQFWATWLARPLTALLPTRADTDDPRPGQTYTPKSEQTRQKAVDQLDLTSAATDERLMRIVVLAQRAFNAETALITVIDRGRQLNLTHAGRRLREVARIESICNLAIQGHGAMIVRDTHEDRRFRNSPLVTGQPHIRFYAGFPIETPSGERIGTLCVVDSQPRRRADDIDVALLRELGHLVQQEMERHMPSTWDCR